MQKAYDNKEPNNYLLVEVSPEILRNIANRIEFKVGVSNPGQTVTIKFTEDIIFFTRVEGLHLRERK